MSDRKPATKSRGNYWILSASHRVYRSTPSMWAFFWSGPPQGKDARRRYFQCFGDRRVARTRTGQTVISTVFLGVGGVDVLSTAKDGVFETLIIGGPLDGKSFGTPTCSES